MCKVGCIPGLPWHDPQFPGHALTGFGVFILVVAILCSSINVVSYVHILVFACMNESMNLVY